MTLMLHGYWRSGAAYRVKLALALKGLPYDEVTHDLRVGEQREAGYRALAPQGLVPALITPDGPLVQSPAILAWLGERHPDPPLLPTNTADRPVVRAMAATIACDIHPINNSRVLTRLRDDLAADESQVEAWIAHWISEGFAALETMISRNGDGFAFGDKPTIADCHLVPQVYSAERFRVDLPTFPRLAAAAAAMRALPAAAAARPDAQPDTGRT